MRHPLPPLPEWFEKELEAIYQVGGKPLFRVVNGQTETHFANGNPHNIKHWEIDGETGRRIGRNCYVLERFQSPDDLERAGMTREIWEANRLLEMDNGQMVDWLGEFPGRGRYVWCSNFMEDDGSLITPTRETLQKIKDAFERHMKPPTETDAEAVARWYQEEEDRNKQWSREFAENFFQLHGVAARSQFYNTEVSKPINKILTEEKA